MKKLLLLVLLVFCVVSCAVASDVSTRSKSDVFTETNISTFKNAHILLNYSLKTYSSGKKGVFYSDAVAVLQKLRYKEGVEEVKFIKLKNSCSKLPAVQSKIGPATACGKIILDVNGFDKGSNQLFQDKSSVQAKDQFILYMYANAVKPAYLSPEDLLLMTNPVQ